MSSTIHRLHMAEVSLPGQFNPPTFKDTRIAVFAYLVATGTEVLLVDTGVGIGNAYIDATFAPERIPISDALAPFGLSPEDVTIVVNSHLHFDHCGNNNAFNNARIFVQKNELQVARAGRYTVQEWFDYPGADLQAVSGDTVVADGIRLIATPGHTPGHQSVVVETPTGLEVVAAQAAFTAEEYQRGGDPNVQAHEGYASEYVASLARLQTMRPSCVYFSHDRREAA